ncbi:hypothetical protein LJR235_000436 [Pararhizobium sp. LjRoot235]|uniref:hypothetical protein n=1 Tax=Pararhizobium sp. LjRoot235 TaxID=3342291 RepID=UPI003ECFA67D
MKQYGDSVPDGERVGRDLDRRIEQLAADPGEGRAFAAFVDDAVQTMPLCERSVSVLCLFKPAAISHVGDPPQRTPRVEAEYP